MRQFHSTDACYLPKACRALEERRTSARLERKKRLPAKEPVNTDYGYTQSLIHERHTLEGVVVDGVVVVVGDGMGSCG